MRYWQDFQPGESLSTDHLTVTHEDILEFAAEFDPQPYHLDSSAAEQSIFGGLCASGWQVTALMMRLVTDALQAHEVATLGSSGVTKLRWKVPVFAGDSLSARLTVVDCRATGQEGPGAMDCEVVVENQHGKAVLESIITLLIQTSHSGAGTGAAKHG